MFMRRRFQKCYCMNNNSNDYKIDVMEDKCDNKCCNQFDDEDECACGFDEGDLPVLPENPMLAQSYVPYQHMDKTFKPCFGLKMGTIFPELVSPYEPCQSIEEINFIKCKNSIGEGCNK